MPKPIDDEGHPLWPDAAALSDEDERLHLLREAYYDVLNQDQKFRLTLRTLFETLARDPEFIEKDDEELFEPASTASQKALIRNFVVVMGLPADDGESDLWDSFLWRESNDWALHAWLDFPRDGSSRFRTLLQPPLLPPFPYNPTVMPRSAVNDYVERISRKLSQSIRSQADQIEELAEQNGWKRPSPHYLNAADLQQRAKRVYRRVMLDWSWKQIADTESNENSRYVSSRTVQDTVEHWAKLLKIPLPPNRPGPRRK